MDKNPPQSKQPAVLVLPDAWPERPAETAPRPATPAIFDMVGGLQMSKQRDQIFPALIRALAAAGTAKKDTENPFEKYQYATLEGIREASREALAENDLGVFGTPEYDPSALLVRFTMMIIHASGQWISGMLEMPVMSTRKDGSITSQAVGAAITYARKYMLSAMTNVATDVDADNDSKDPDANGGWKPRENGSRGGDRSDRGGNSRNGRTREQSDYWAKVREKVENCVYVFGQHGISREQLEQYVGKASDKWDRDELTRLNDRLEAVKAGEPFNEIDAIGDRFGGAPEPAPTNGSAESDQPAKSDTPAKTHATDIGNII